MSHQVISLCRFGELAWAFDPNARVCGLNIETMSFDFVNLIAISSSYNSCHNHVSVHTATWYPTYNLFINLHRNSVVFCHDQMICSSMSTPPSNLKEICIEVGVSEL